MRALDPKEPIEEIGERAGRPLDGSVPRQIVRDVSGCAIFVTDQIHSAELEAIFPMPGTQIIWFSPEVFAECSAHKHDRFIRQELCHSYDGKLYCFCP